MRWVVKATEQHQGELPVFPWVASRLVGLLEQPGARLSEIESLISQDQVITAHLLRTANSSLFGGAMPLERVGQAVARLGFRETASVAMAAACRCLYDVEDRAELAVFPEVWHALWHDSLACAYGARLLARELKRGDPERVFLAALFRNVGSLLVLKIVARGLVRGRLEAPVATEALESVLRALHADLGANYLRSCHMPDHVVAAAQSHHAPLLRLSADTLDLHLVRVADGLCERIGVAPFASGEMTLAGEQSLAQLELGPPQQDYFELQLRALAEQLRELL